MSTEPAFRRVSSHEVKPQYERDEVTLIDVREADQFTASHIPGALQIHLARIEGEIPYLPKGKPIVTYCTWPRKSRAARPCRSCEMVGLPTELRCRVALPRGGRRDTPWSPGFLSGRNRQSVRAIASIGLRP